MKNQRPSHSGVAILHVEPVNHHDDHILMQQKIADLEYELMIVRQAAKIGAAHDFETINTMIEKLCHERKLTKILKKELKDLKQSVEVATVVTIPSLSTIEIDNVDVGMIQ